MTKQGYFSGCRRKMIATDGVFSMDGDIAPLKQICDLADRYGALVFVDEAHSTGFFGPTGRGTEEYFGKLIVVVACLFLGPGSTCGFTEIFKSRSGPTFPELFEYDCSFFIFQA